MAVLPVPGLPDRRMARPPIWRRGGDETTGVELRKLTRRKTTTRHRASPSSPSPPRSFCKRRPRPSSRRPGRPCPARHPPAAPTRRPDNDPTGYIFPEPVSPHIDAPSSVVFTDASARPPFYGNPRSRRHRPHLSQPFLLAVIHGGNTIALLFQIGTFLAEVMINGKRR